MSEKNMAGADEEKRLPPSKTFKMKAATMRAVRCHRFAALDKSGKPASTPAPIREVIQLEQVTTPKPRNDGVLVSCHYAGIQYPDFLQAQVILKTYHSKT